MKVHGEHYTRNTSARENEMHRICLFVSMSSRNPEATFDVAQRRAARDAIDSGCRIRDARNRDQLAIEREVGTAGTHRLDATLRLPSLPWYHCAVWRGMSVQFSWNTKLPRLTAVRPAATAATARLARTAERGLRACRQSGPSQRRTGRYPLSPLRRRTAGAARHAAAGRSSGQH